MAGLLEGMPPMCTTPPLPPMAFRSRWEASSEGRSSDQVMWLT